MLDFNKHDLSIALSEKVWTIVLENNFEKREFLYREYEDLERLISLYEHHIDEKLEEFSWKTCIEKGWMSFQDCGHFKNIMLKEGITEEEWRKYLYKAWGDWGTDKIESGILEYDQYRKDHKYDQTRIKT